MNEKTGPLQEHQLANDDFEKKDLNNKTRQVTQDARNVSANMGRRQGPASLSFDFENKPGAPEKKHEVRKDAAAKAPDAKKGTPEVHKDAPKIHKEAPKVYKEVPRDTLEPRPKAAPKEEKQYGLPKDYRLTSKTPVVKPEEKPETPDDSPMAQVSAFMAAKMDSAKKFAQKKMAERQEAARIAREAAAERRRQEAKARAEAAKNGGAAAAKSGSKPSAGGAGKSAPKSGNKKNAQKPKTGLKQTVVKKAKTINKSGSGSKKKGGKKSKPRGKYRWILSVLEILLALMIIGGIAGGAYAAITIAKAPTIHPDQIYNTLDVSTHIYDDKGVLTDDIYYSENREIAKYDELPDNLKNAFIAIEDKTFWTHKGFNIKRIFGAILNSVRGGGEISGTSTITQQLARNVFLPEEKSIRSIKRKIIEMYYAHEIEESLTKEEILTAYLNTIYLGYGCYGVDTAAKKYFGVEIGDLTLEECAALAALPQAPGVYALLMTEGDDAETTTDLGDGLYANDISRDRRYLVLDLMAEQGYITAEDAEAAKKPLADFINPGGASMSSANSAFKDYLLETVKKDLMAQYGMDETQANNMIYTKGLEIYSTLDSQAQKAVVKQFKKKENFPSALKEGSNVEAAMVITEIGTGQIKAMVGTRHADGEKLFNRATSPRQPGSSIKPLAVYAPALQKSYEYEKEGKKFEFKDTGYDSQGKKYWGDYITTSSGVKDEKMKVKGKTWPKNFGRTYTGYKTFRQAIQLSINTCAVKILAQIGVDYSMEMVKKFGITTVIDDTSQPYNDLNLAALGLGAMTEGVTPLDMALAYAVFPNGGVHNSGICYTQVTDSDGNVLLEGKSVETEVLNPGVAYIMTDVLQSVVTDGIAGNAAIKGEEVGGKTGTTDETWDIWFDGFTANYSAALWIGTDDNAELSATSEKAALLWSKIMSKVKRAKGGEYKSKPDNVIAKNGELYTKGTQPPDPPPPPKKEEKKDDKADHSSTTEPDPNAVDNTGNPAAPAPAN